MTSCLRNSGSIFSRSRRCILRVSRQKLLFVLVTKHTFKILGYPLYLSGDVLLGRTSLLIVIKLAFFFVKNAFRKSSPGSCDPGIGLYIPTH